MTRSSTNFTSIYAPMPSNALTGLLLSDINDIVSDSLAYLARNLKYYRAQLGLTQVELAQKSGVNRSYLASIESETQPNTSIKTVEKLATALGVTVIALLQPPSER
ncbi:MAG: XRE family transcriptional regulator [Caldilinea sp. CFX5]|nr:XRE family transcriptional regulator [Caldilinea sp. CFX5]